MQVAIKNIHSPKVYDSKLLSVVRSSMHPCPGNWVAIRRAAVYNARAAHAFNAGSKCRYSISLDPFIFGVPCGKQLVDMFLSKNNQAMKHSQKFVNVFRNDIPSKMFVKLGIMK